MDPIDLSFVRVSLNFGIAIFVLCYFGKRPIEDMPKDMWCTLIVRSILGTVAFTFMVYACKYLHVFIVQIIYNTAPFWTSILAYCVNGETVTTC